MPRRIQQIPGLGQGGLGWQGIVPSRAAKMGSIAVDKGIAKLGSPGDFYRQLDPEAIAEQILATARGDDPRRGRADHGARAPAALARPAAARARGRPRPGRGAAAARSCARSPTRSATHVDELIDVKLMVIRRLEANPALANRIFLEVGRKELRFIVNFGFFFGLLLGHPDRLPHPGGADPVVGAADRRRADRLHDQPARHPDDLRAGAAAAGRAVRAPGPLPQAPARGRRGLRRHHRRRRGDDDQRRPRT